jgi:ATP-dependent helicase/nuclease subunit A
MKKQMYGEELRVLYVALTRAEEKLILTGQVSDSEKLTAAVAMQNNFRMKRESGQDETVERMLASPMDFTALLSAKTFLEMILAVIPEEKDMKLHAVEAGELAAGEASEKMQRSAVLEEITGLAKLPEEKKIFDPDVNRLMKEVRAFSYPYEEQAKMPAKLTVTEIKKRAQRTELQEDELPAATVFEPEEEELIPKFLRGTDEEEKTGASRGTVYHHFLECLDYGKLRPGATEEERTAFVEAERKRMLEKGLMTREDDACMYTPDFVRFLACGLGQRMKAASDAGTLHREQPFVMDIPAKDIDSQWPEGENILVQGTIDAYFSEEGKYVLVDYKTDRIHSLDADGNPDERELVEKYHKQLEYYAAALTRITGTEVGEMYIYSVRLGREIKL